MRQGIAGDLEFDPSFREQRELARILIGAAVNQLRGRSSMPRESHTNADMADAIEKLALEAGIVWYDDFHHAPLCRANNWSRRVLPTGICTCGAQRLGIR